MIPPGMNRQGMKREARKVMRGKPSGPGWLLGGLLLLAAIIAGILRALGG